MSVPINMAYNHHHCTTIVGKGSSMVTMKKEAAAALGLRSQPLSGGADVWAPVEHTPSASGLPTSAMMDDGNGGEYRKVGAAPPFLPPSARRWPRVA